MMSVLEITNWVKQYAPFGLDEALHADINKAGVVFTFQHEHSLETLLIKPQPKKRDSLGMPPWQIIKGTRMINLKGGKLKDYHPNDKDYKKGDLEPLLVTALREGIEESGLKLENIDSVEPAGLYYFRSASTKEKKSMILYTVTIKDKFHFDWPTPEHPDTAHMQWFSVSHLPEDIRADAKKIIKKMFTK